jgi:hypothetical protein
MTETVAAGQVGGRKAVRGGEGDFDGPGGRQVRAKTRAGLPVESGERAHRDRSDRKLVLLQDDEADTAAGGGVDAVPAEELLHRDRVVRLVGQTKIVGQGAETARIPPAPDGDQRGAEQKPDQRRGEATEPRMPEEELQHEGEGR